MSLHVFGTIVTGTGCAANNRGENEGNITTLQKLLWKGQVHTTVSAEAIRWAIRYFWQCQGLPVNRFWDYQKADHVWKDQKWGGWNGKGKETYIDDDLMGFMLAEGSKTEGEKGTTLARRGVLEVSRAISTTPYVGDISFNAKSGEKGRTSLYGTEMHSTRYQYSFALTPERLLDNSRCLAALDAVGSLGEVAGNQSRFLFDFSPESILLRISQDPAPRILYIFQEENGHISAPELVKKVQADDIQAAELFIGGRISEDSAIQQLGAKVCNPGVLATVNAAQDSIRQSLNIT